MYSHKKELKDLKREPARERESVFTHQEQSSHVSSSAPLRVREENSMGSNNTPRQKWRNYFDMFGDVLIRLKHSGMTAAAPRSTGRVMMSINREVLHSLLITMVFKSTSKEHV